MTFHGEIPLRTAIQDLDFRDVDEVVGCVSATVAVVMSIMLKVTHVESICDFKEQHLIGLKSKDKNELSLHASQDPSCGMTSGPSTIVIPLLL